MPQDVGGAVINATTGMSSHGSRANDGWTSMAGITMNAMASQGFTTRLIYSMASLQEVTLDYSANTAEVPTGGVRINIIPREGGNTFNGTFFSSIATGAMQANNLTDELKSQGLRTPDAVRKLWDVNPGFGGPLPPRQGLVLRVGAVVRVAAGRRRHVLQQEREQSRMRGPTNPTWTGRRSRTPTTREATPA